MWYNQATMTEEFEDAFTAPEWLLTEVTQEKCFAGGVLCGKSYADIENQLVRYGYTPIEERGK